MTRTRTPTTRVGFNGLGSQGAPMGRRITELLDNFVFTLADGLGMDRAFVAQVAAHGTGGSRAAAILAASGFNADGLRQALPLPHKDVDLLLDAADPAGAPRPRTLTDLTAHTLSTLGRRPAP